LQFSGINYSLSWSNDLKGGLLALANDTRLILLNPDCISQSNYQNNQFLLEETETNHKALTNKLLDWTFFENTSKEWKEGQRLEISLNASIKHVAFHEKGEYLATVCPNSSQQNDVVMVHSLQKGTSQRPFNKSKAGIQKVEFHPNKPFLFLLTQKNTYIYNLQKQVKF